MRWIGLGVVQIRSISSEAPGKDFSRVASLYNLWKKYKFRQQILTSPEQPAVEITRTDRKHDFYSNISLREGCPRVLLMPPEFGTIDKIKAQVKGYLRNAFVRGIGLQDKKAEFHEYCGSLFIEVLKAYRKEDFSGLTEFTLGGNEALQFHRSAAHKLIKVQKEALNITRDDFLGDNGFIIKFPYLRHEMGPYIHSIEFTNVDAAGNTYPMDGENQGDKVFCRYKVVLGGVYKFESLRKQIQKESDMWTQRIKTPKDYIFKWPRYTFVELDFCQQAYSQMPIKLDESSRYLYDIHVFSF